MSRFSGGGGGVGVGVTCMCHNTGMCHYFGDFCWGAPGFLGTLYGVLPDFGYSFWGASGFWVPSLGIPGFLGIIFLVKFYLF